MKQTDVVPKGLRRMSRGWRVALFTIAMIVTVAVVIPGYIVGTGYLVGFGACDRPDIAANASVCSPLGRLLFTGLGIAVAVPLGRSWARFLGRALGLTDDNPLPQNYTANQVTGGFNKASSLTLPLGQQLLSGRIESCGRSGRYVVLGGITLTFWSLYPFQKGWLKEGDQVAVVYQRLPLSKSKLALAFWSESAWSVRGVATVIQSAGMLTALVCIPILILFKAPAAGFLVKVLGLTIIVESLYLMLMMRAKSAITEFINREAQT